MARQQIDTQRTVTGQEGRPDLTPGDGRDTVESPIFLTSSSWKTRLGAWLADKLERLAKNS